MYVDAATAAILGFHSVLSIRSRAKDAWKTYGITTFLRVFIRLMAATTVPGSSERVLTRFPKRASKSTNGQTASDSLEIYFYGLEPVKQRAFSFVLVGARSAPWGSPIFLQQTFPSLSITSKKPPPLPQHPHCI